MKITELKPVTLPVTEVRVHHDRSIEFFIFPHQGEWKDVSAKAEKLYGNGWTVYIDKGRHNISVSGAAPFTPKRTNYSIGFTTPASIKFSDSNAEQAILIQSEKRPLKCTFTPGLPSISAYRRPRNKPEYNDVDCR